MKCSKCNAVVSMADRVCPKCNNNLLKFGTMSSQPENKDSFRKSIKNKVFAGFGEEMKEINNFTDSDGLEEIFAKISKKLSNIFAKRMTEEEVDNIYETVVAQILDELYKDTIGKILCTKVELFIKNNLGDGVYQYYYNECHEIIEMLLAGELACIFLKTENIDMSVKLFEFFKSCEVACQIHTKGRLQQIINHPKVSMVDNAIGEGTFYDRIKNIAGKDIPDWFEAEKDGKKNGHKGALLNLLDMLLGRASIKNLRNSRNAGLALYVFGRELLQINGKTIDISNIFKANGSMSDREILAKNLCELQYERNEMIHERVIDNNVEVEKWKRISYDCLKAVPAILNVN